MKRKLTVFLALFFLGIGIVAAQTQVRGTVVNEAGEPVIGATIQVKGTSQGTVTDFNGIFNLSAPTGGTLVVSYVGYATQEIPVSGNVRVVLVTDTELLEELVVTGYGVTTKKAFTGAAQAIDSKEVTKITNADPMQALQGQIAGFQISAYTGQPGGYNEVLIRGLGSFNSGTQPLYVIDGVPMTTGEFGMRYSEGQNINPLSAINPNDIQSISVLKDASATSIYGARAANGVIVITTKQGKEGKTKINLSTKLGQASMPSIGKYKQLNAAEWVDFIGVMAKNRGYLEADATTTDVQNFIKDDMELNYDPAGNVDTNWFNEVTRKGFTQEYNLDISGGNDNLKFFLSGGLYDELGTVIGKDLKRYSGRLNIENKISNAVRIGLNLTGSYANINMGAGGGYFSDPITQAYMQLPVQPVTKEDGSWNMDTDNGYNPVAQRSKYGDKSETKQIKAIISPWLSWKFSDFVFTSKYGLDFYNVKEFGRWSMLQPQGKDMKMLGEEGNTYRTLWTFTNTLNYLKQYNDVHNLNVLLGQEAQKATDESAYMSNSNFPSEIVFTLENGSKPGDASTSIANYSLLSYFVNGEYDFDNRYYLSASVRRDASSRFGADYRWGTFWSLGGKYRIIEESFMEPTTDWLSNLVLRASYGTTGNQDIGWYQALGTYRFGYNYANRPGMIPYRIANPELRWEQTNKLNIGFELGLLRKITLDLDYYVNKTVDMLFEVPLSRSTGFENIMQNVGSMENRGIEAILNVNALNLDKFRWDVSLNMTHNKNKIVKLSTDKPIEGTYTIREVGYPYHQFKMKEYAGVDPETGKQLWYKGEEGTETTTDYNAAGKRYLGTADPKIYGGFSNMFRIYDFDLSVLLNYSFGGKVYNSAARYDENTRNLYGNTTQYVYENMWRQKGDVTNVPAPDTRTLNSHSSYYLMDGSYIKLKSLQVGYNFPKKLISNWKVENIRLFVTGDNLAAWALGDDFRGMDPEAESSGIIWWNYPVPRKVLFGLNIGF